jgi:hypothetical protein
MHWDLHLTAGFHDLYGHLVERRARQTPAPDSTSWYGRASILLFACAPNGGVNRRRGIRIGANGFVRTSADRSQVVPGTCGAGSRRQVVAPAMSAEDTAERESTT